MSDVINAHDLGVAGGYIIKAAMQRDIDKLKAENAKLRELVRDLWEYIYIGTAQDGQSLHDRTRDLGVEVDA